MKIAALFPSQMTQHSGQWLYDNFTYVKEIYKEASDYLHIDFARIGFQGTKEELEDMKIGQPLVLLTGYATAKVMEQELGMVFDYAAGTSVGEYTALAVAEAFTFEDALRLVQLRGRQMEEAAKDEKGAMFAILGKERDDVEEFLRKNREQVHFNITSYNSPEQTLILGPAEEADSLKGLLSQNQMTGILIDENEPYQGQRTKEIAAFLKESLEGVTVKKPKISIISSVTGLPYYNEKHIKDALVNQLLRETAWRSTMKFLYVSEVDAVVDMGPGETMKKLSIQNYPGMNAFSIEKDWDVIKKQLTEGC